MGARPPPLRPSTRRPSPAATTHLDGNVPLCEVLGRVGRGDEFEAEALELEDGVHEGGPVLGLGRDDDGGALGGHLEVGGE